MTTPKTANGAAVSSTELLAACEVLIPRLELAQKDKTLGRVIQEAALYTQIGLMRIRLAIMASAIAANDGTEARRPTPLPPVT